jgi:hypothetical protein
MSGKWMVWVLAFGLTTTLINLAIFTAQITTPASARERQRRQNAR